MDDLEDFEISQEDLAEIDNIEINLLNTSFQLSSDDELCAVPMHRRKRQRILSESEDSENEHRVVPDTSDNTPSSSKWAAPLGKQRTIIPYTEISGVSSRVRNSMSNKSPHDFFELLVSDELFQEIADCTNQFAVTTIVTSNEASRYARLRKWKPTNITEMKKFFGLILFMGIVKLPRIADYWSKNEIIGHPFPRTVMSRNRFELLLQMLHFSKDDDSNKSDRLHRIKSLLQKLNTNFQKNYTPTQDLCIDESMIPFRGRIIFRQYNKQKRHKYGIKEFKLCTMPGYTYKVNIYAGKNDATNTTPTNVVMDLCSGLLNKGHTLYTDNWYTSVDLARKLLDQETHLVGTLRKNRKHIPKTVVSTKLKKGQYIARESEDGITVMKWKDKRDVLVLSTKHSVRFHEVTKRGKVISKPQIIVDYNKGKGAVDLSDQMTAYSSPLRKSVKWYKKLAVDLMLNTSVVNALTLYKTVTKKNIQIVEFRKEILKHLCQIDEEAAREAAVQRPRRMKHILTKKEGKAREVRRTCKQCYKLKTATMTAKAAKNKSKKVVTYCESCPGKPYLCLDCFNIIHSK